jgi:arylsulfatase A
MTDNRKKPNVVLINCDDMGYGDLGCYGSTKNKTPSIDALASEGMRFTDAYCTSPVCSPSRAGLLTGCYPPHLDFNRVLFPADSMGLNPAEYTLPMVFKEKGYATKCVGKWHIGDQPEFLPLNFGFDSYFGLPYSNDMGMQTGKAVSWKCPPLPLLQDHEVIQQQPDQRGLTERYVEKCIEFIRSNKEHPFFLYFAQMHVHLPLYAAERFVKQSQNGDYGACVEEVDWSVSALIHELKHLHLLEDTLIIFTSDNGSRGDYGSSNEPLRGGKFTNYEGGQRIPFITYWKDHIPAGLVNTHTISQIDLFPTLASLIGHPLITQYALDGIDCAPCLFSPEIMIRDEFVYWGWSSQNKAYLNAIRMGDWKLHVGTCSTDGNKPATELYNLRSDPGETTNLYAFYPDVVAKLSTRLAYWEERYGNAYHEGSTGTACHVCGKVEQPVTLTEYDENHPYMVALYDKNDRG